MTNQMIETRKKLVQLLDRLIELAPEDLSKYGDGRSYFFYAYHGLSVNEPDYIHPDNPIVDATVLGGVLTKFADRQKGKGSLDSDDIDLRLREGDWYCEIFSCQDELSAAVSSSPGLAALTAYVEYLEGSV